LLLDSSAACRLCVGIVTLESAVGGVLCRGEIKSLTFLKTRALEMSANAFVSGIGDWLWIIYFYVENVYRCSALDKVEIRNGSQHSTPERSVTFFV
jgi:hypothetical protein